VAGKGQERRLEQRVASDAALQVEYIFPAPQVHDVSQSGVYLLDNRTFQRGQILQLRLRFADGDSFVVKGIVRRHDPGKGTAFEFMEIDPAARRRLREIVSKRGAKDPAHIEDF
jgi:hypothetical protein